MRRDERGGPRDSEQQALRRARRSISIRIAVVMTLVIGFTGGVVYLVMLAGQSRDVQRDLEFTADHGTVTSTPGCVWLTVDQAGKLTSSPGTPGYLPIRSTLAQVAAGGGAVRTSAKLGGTTYELLTQRRGADTVQVAYDTRFQAADREDLVLALALAEAVGLLGAVIGGGALSRRAMAPVAAALGRQRRFVADASHELRTPLTQLHTRTQLLVRRARRGELAPAELDVELDRLMSGTRQLGDVVEDLLLSTQLTNGPRRLDPMDLAVVVAQAVDAETERAQALGLTVRMSREPGEYEVAGIPSALRRVVSALLDNAIGHTPPGGEILVSLAAPDRGTIRLSVRDNGVGFDTQDAERIFERFARGGAGRGRRFGLGLALVREVVDNHHGSITATGKPGHGAEFTVRLPALRTAPTPPAGSRQRATRPAPTGGPLARAVGAQSAKFSRWPSA
ncbi:MAG TPA: HAMP domain-containing sensor histidine kinase [Pseudonocardiaceae bacterium]|nr:HAMP domain-containing sensor histidine kinase [Pseudonocardiaceae bacterium]